HRLINSLNRRHEPHEHADANDKEARQLTQCQTRPNHSEHADARQHGAHRVLPKPPLRGQYATNNATCARDANHDSPGFAREHLKSVWVKQCYVDAAREVIERRKHHKAEEPWHREHGDPSPSKVDGAALEVSYDLWFRYP